MEWSKLKHTTRCAVVHIICLILGILLLVFCSCDNETAIDGIVNRVEQTSDYGYKYKVQVKKFKFLPEIEGGHYYWFLTNDTLFVGDTIHIGKLKEE